MAQAQAPVKIVEEGWELDLAQARTMFAEHEHFTGSVDASDSYENLVVNKWSSKVVDANVDPSSGFPIKKRRIKTPGPPVRPQCSECGKDFSNQSALSKHKLTHSDERRFVCNLCQKAFKRQDHLNGHMLTHRDKKPFECDVEGCEKTYCDARSLRRHKENHHAASGSNAANFQNNLALVSRSILNRIQYAPAQPVNGLPSTQLGSTVKPGAHPFAASAATHLQLLAMQQQPLYAEKSHQVLQQDQQHSNQQQQTTQPQQASHSQHFQPDVMNDKERPGENDAEEDSRHVGQAFDHPILKRVNDPQNLLHQLLTQQLKEPAPENLHIFNQLAPTLTNCNNNNNNETTSNGWTGVEHVNKLIESQINQVECSICQRRFKNLPALNGHMRLHGGYMKNPQTISGSPSNTINNSGIQPNMNKKKEDVTHSDPEAKALIDAIKEKILQKHAITSMNNSNIILNNNNNGPSNPFLIRTLSGANPSNEPRSNKEPKDECTDENCTIDLTNSMKPVGTVSPSVSCFSYQNTTSTPNYLPPHQDTATRIVSPPVHHDIQSIHSDALTNQGPSLLQPQHHPSNEIHRAQDNGHIETQQDVHSSFSSDQNQELDRLLSGKGEESMKEVGSSEEDHIDSNWYHNIALLKEQLQQQFRIPNDVSSNMSDMSRSNRSQFVSSGEKSRRHSDSTAEMVFSSSTHYNKMRPWTENDAHHVNNNNDNNPSLSPPSSSNFLANNFDLLKRRSQRAISDPGNGELEEQDVPGDLSQSGQQQQHHQGTIASDITDNNLLTVNVNKVYHHNTHHHYSYNHHQQQHHPHNQHPLHSHSVPTTPTNLNPLLSPAVPHPIANQNHFNQSLPCTPTQANSFSFSPHQVQQYHQQQSLPPTPTDNQLQFNFPAQQQNYSSPSYNVTPTQSTPPVPAFNFPAPENQSQSRQQAQPTLEPIYEEINYPTNDEENVNEHDVNFDNFEMESLIEHISTQEQERDRQTHQQQEQAQQQQHQQEQEQQQRQQQQLQQHHQHQQQHHHQHHTNNPCETQPQQASFDQSPLLDHSQAHQSSIPSSSQQQHLSTPRPSALHHRHLGLPNIPSKPQSFFPGHGDDLGPQSLEGPSLNYSLQAHDYSDIPLSNTSPIETVQASGSGKKITETRDEFPFVNHFHGNLFREEGKDKDNSSNSDSINNNNTQNENSEDNVEELMGENSCSLVTTTTTTPRSTLRSSPSNLVINLSPSEDKEDRDVNGLSEGEEEEDDEEDEEDDDVFINPANISPVTSPKTKTVIKTSPANERSSPKRPKHKPEPLYIPPHVNAFGQYASRLRSPRLWDPAGLHPLPSHGHQDVAKSSPPPYTPPPMLSPLRKGSGLYWAIINNGNVTPKSATLGTFIYGRKSISTPCEKDIGGQNNELISSTPTTAYEPEVTYDLDLLPSESDIQPHVNIGPQYQASIPAFIGDKTDCQRRYRRERADLVWNPTVLKKMDHPEDLDSYLELACSGCVPGAGRNIEFALHLLYLCDGDLELAISKLLNTTDTKLQPDHPLIDYQYPESDVWSQEEITLYYQALIKFDKDFHAIAKKVKSKTVKECIQFYYLWKKICPDEYKRLRIVRRRKEQEGLFYSNAVMGKEETEDTNGGNNSAGEANDEDNLSLSALDSPLNLSPSSVCSNAGGGSGSREKSIGDYPCRVCGKVFTKVKSRSAHMKVHGAGAAPNPAFTVSK